MPLNSIPPTTTLANLRVKQAEARDVGVCCDVGFWGGIVPGNSKELLPLLDAGVKGFKCFLINSGVEVCTSELLIAFETDSVQEFPHVCEEDLIEACEALAVSGLKSTA